LDREVATQDATIANQQKQIEVLSARLKDQAEQIHKVRAELELKQQPSVLVRNDHSNKR
jgi:uncharacterized coiled-coil protein SlyX